MLHLLGSNDNRHHGDGKAASNWVTQEVLRVLKDRELPIEDFPVAAETLAGMLGAIKAGELPGARAKDVFQLMLSDGVDVPTAIGQPMSVDGP